MSVLEPLEEGIAGYVAEAAALSAAENDATLDWPARRAGYRRRCRHFDGARAPGVDVLDAAAPGPAGAIPVRVYRREGERARPAVTYFHGGGWVVGDLETHDGVAAAIAARTGLVVVAVDYRLAPEHPYPAAFDDAYAATAHVVREGARWGIDGRVVVAGDSAGGNLAAAVALAARDRGGPALAGQALIYPCLDARLSLPSHSERACAPMLSTAEMAEYWRLYLGGRAPDGYAAPLEAASLAGLPPAYVAVAAHDPLCDDGRVYADRLRAAGVPVALRTAGRLVHGYLRARHVSDDARAEFHALCDALVGFAR